MTVPRTIQLADDTYEALRTYKVAGLTFDDVVRRLMDAQDPEAFLQEYRAWQKRTLAKMRRGGRFKPL